MVIVVETADLAVHVSTCPAETPTDAPRSVVGGHSYECCLVRQGCFAYRDNRGKVLVDPNTCIFGVPEQQGEVNHPATGGDQDTMVFFSQELFAGLAGGEETLPLAAPVTPQMQILHRRLLAAARSGSETMAVEEVALQLISSGLSHVEPRRTAAHRPSTRNARRDLAEDARLLLTTDPAISTVTELARRLYCSPHHLSRTFSALTGTSLSTYRTWLRLNRAFECILDNRMPLAEIATACGFVDHGHLTRTIRRHTGATPTHVRALLAGSTVDRV